MTGRHAHDSANAIAGGSRVPRSHPLEVVKKTQLGNANVGKFANAERFGSLRGTHLGGAVHGILLQVLLVVKQLWGGIRAVSFTLNAWSTHRTGTVDGTVFARTSRGEETAE